MAYFSKTTVILLLVASVVVTGVFTIASIPVGAQATLTLIKAGKLVDPATGETLVNQFILVEGQRIKEVGPDLDLPEDARVIDLSEYTVLPGLFDAHTHMCLTTLKTSTMEIISSRASSFRAPSVRSRAWPMRGQCSRPDSRRFVMLETRLIMRTRI